jgi:hypothetical protein
MNPKRVIPAFCLAVFLTIVVPGWAQVQFGTFTGEVTDQSGALVPNASVTITNLGTSFAISVKTGSSGLYRLEALPVGRYEIKVEAAGFKTDIKTGLQLNAGTIARVDFELQVGTREEVVTVEAITPLVNTEDSRLQLTVSGGEVSELPLNGRNVYSLIQLAPGAVNATGVSFENGEGTVINGLRPNFIGFTINGVSNKGLSAGRNTLPNPEIVAEFQMLTLNMSAQYGNSAAAITNLVTKSGTNDFHGSVFYFFRNDALDATEFFLNQQSQPTKKVRFNQFGASATGRIIKDKLFFTGSWQSSRFKTQGQPVPILVESPQWRQAIIGANPNSVAALIYANFPPTVAGTPFLTLAQFVDPAALPGASDFGAYVCPASTRPSLAAQFQTLFGVTANDTCSVPIALQPGLISRDIPFFNRSVAVFEQQTETFGNLREADEWSTRIDWVRGTKDRVFGEFYWELAEDTFGPANNSSGPRGFANPQEIFTPNFQFAWVHTATPTIVNELRVGFARGRNDISVATPGVPSLVFGDGSAGFGSYNGYPQFFRENIYTYSDMMSITKGTHSMKMGVEFRRNLENSIFNVGRPSYYFFDQLYFAVDAPAEEVAGVDPGLDTGEPAFLDENNRAWRNLEMGAFFQDDWKVTRNLTLNLGLRYDLYTRHVEKFDRETTFIPGIGTDITEQIANANVPCTAPDAVMAGACGPGGFNTTNALGGSDHNNFGPRVGIAWDVRGDGKTAIRAGFGISFEGTLYNPLSNSRWNPPFYSFNIADNDLFGDTSCIVYGPTSSTVFDPVTGCPVRTADAPSFTGPDPNPGAGTGDLGTGNIQGWWPANPNLAFLTGIVFPEGIDDPWITNFHVGVQHEIAKDTVLEVNYVGTRGEDLFRAQQVNRRPGVRLNPATFGPTFTNARGETLVTGTNAGGPGRFLNTNYGRLRVWQNVTDSWYDALQVSLRKAFSHGFMVHANYTWSHSLDTGSGWHSGAVTANGAAAGDGYSLDQTNPDLDKGNSTFDIRHRFIADWLWELPIYRGQREGAAAKILGGWQFNGSISAQSGAHWTPYCAASFAGGCDYNADGEPNDRPDAPNGDSFNAGTDHWANGFFNVPGSAFASALDFFAAPCFACNGSLGRNTFVGPNQFTTDMSLFKNIPVTETSTLQFRFEVFNAFNHTNFLLPSSGTGANFANRITSSIFGAAAGTLNARNIQFGLKFLW